MVLSQPSESSPSIEETKSKQDQDQPDGSPRIAHGDPAEYRAVHREWIRQKEEDAVRKNGQNSSSNEEED